MNIFQLGDFTLNSGRKSILKIECDSLTDDDIKTVATVLAQKIGLFSTVEGIPRGGLRLAKAMEEFAVGKTAPHLIVDDVFTTGGSIIRARESYLKRTPGGLTEPRSIDEYPKAAVIFARGHCPSWIIPFMTLSERLWDI
jgi:orotate phosphoribosyltransferase